MSEWLKEHAWKACVFERVPRVRIPLSPPLNPNNQAGYGFLFSRPGYSSAGSYAIGTHEPRQIRKEAALSDHSYVP